MRPTHLRRTPAKRKWWRGKAGGSGSGKSPRAASKIPAAKWGGSCLHPETGPRRSLQAERRPRSARSLAAAPAVSVHVEVPPLATAQMAAASDKAALAGQAREGTPRLSPRTPDTPRRDDGVLVAPSVRSSECGAEIAAEGAVQQPDGVAEPEFAAAAAAAPGDEEAVPRTQRRPRTLQVHTIGMWGCGAVQGMGDVGNVPQQLM